MHLGRGEGPGGTSFLVFKHVIDVKVNVSVCGWRRPQGTTGVDKDFMCALTVKGSVDNPCFPASRRSLYCASCQHTAAMLSFLRVLENHRREECTEHFRTSSLPFKIRKTTTGKFKRLFPSVQQFTVERARGVGSGGQTQFTRPGHRRPDGGRPSPVWSPRPWGPCLRGSDSQTQFTRPGHWRPDRGRPSTVWSPRPWGPHLLPRTSISPNL